MGLFQAIKGTIGGGLADQWLETIEPAEMGEFGSLHVVALGVCSDFGENFVATIQNRY